MDSGLRVLSGVGKRLKRAWMGSIASVGLRRITGGQKLRECREGEQGMASMSLRAWELLGHGSWNRRDGDKHKRDSHGKRVQGSG